MYTELIYTSYINNTSPINIDQAYIDTFWNITIMDVPPLKEEKRRERDRARVPPKEEFLEYAKGSTERRRRAAMDKSSKERRNLMAQRRRGRRAQAVVGGKKTRKKKKRKRKKTRRRKKHKRKTRRKR